MLQDISKRGENPFKPSSPVKEYFWGNKKQFEVINVPEKKETQAKDSIQQHDSNFKLVGNHFNNGVFSYPKYMPEPQEAGNENGATQKGKSVADEKKEPFKLIKQ